MVKRSTFSDDHRPRLDGRGLILVSTGRRENEYRRIGLCSVDMSIVRKRFLRGKRVQVPSPKYQEMLDVETNDDDGWCDVKNDDDLSRNKSSALYEAASTTKRTFDFPQYLNYE